jgi:hypothetical protein
MAGWRFGAADDLYSSVAEDGTVMHPEQPLLNLLLKASQPVLG